MPKMRPFTVTSCHLNRLNLLTYGLARSVTSVAPPTASNWGSQADSAPKTSGAPAPEENASNMFCRTCCGAMIFQSTVRLGFRRVNQGGVASAAPFRYYHPPD